MVEYALALVLLISVFIIAGKLLQEKSNERYENSTQAVNSMAPCGGADGELSEADGECY